MHTQFWTVSIMERYHLEDLNIDEKIILK